VQARRFVIVGSPVWGWVWLLALNQELRVPLPAWGQGTLGTGHPGDEVLGAHGLPGDMGSMGMGHPEDMGSMGMVTPGDRAP